MDIVENLHQMGAEIVPLSESDMEEIDEFVYHTEEDDGNDIQDDGE